MFSRTFASAAVVFAVNGASAFAQFPNLNSPDARARANAQVLAGQVASDLRGIGSQAANSRSPAAADVRARSEQSYALAERLQSAIAAGGAPAVVFGQFRALDRGVDELVGLIRGQAAGDQSLNVFATRADANVNRLGAALAFGPQPPAGPLPPGGWTDPQRETLRRVARSLDGQAESLWSVARQTLPPDRAGQQLEDQIRRFARSTDRIKDALSGNAPLERVRESFAGVQNQWATLVPSLSAIGLNAFPELRLQTAQVDQSMRILTSALGVAPGPLPMPGFPINNGRDQGVIAVGAGRGGVPVVRVYLDRRGLAFHDFMAYDLSFQGGVRVALGDVNGDGIVDVITAPGPGGQPLVRVFDGRDYSLISQFLAFDPRMPGGVWVAAADVTGGGRAEIVTGAGDGGGPHVRFFDGLTGQVKAEFFAHDQRTPCGARVALGDVDGDGVPDVVTAPGPGVEPLVSVFNGRGLRPMGSFLAYDRAFRGGVFVAAADVTGHGRAQVATGAGLNGGPHVRLFDPLTGGAIGDFFAYDRNFLGGVRVALFDAERNRRPAILTAPGPGLPTQLRVTRVSDGRPVGEFTAFDPRFTGGGFVAAN
jgi:hypothetical protein